MTSASAFESSAFESAARAPSMTDKQEYRLLFAATFGIFLVAAIVLRLIHSFEGATPAGSPRSLFAEAKATSYSALAFAFMG